MDSWATTFNILLGGYHCLHLQNRWCQRFRETRWLHLQCKRYQDFGAISLKFLFCSGVSLKRLYSPTTLHGVRLSLSSTEGGCNIIWIIKLRVEEPSISLHLHRKYATRNDNAPSCRRKPHVSRGAWYSVLQASDTKLRSRQHKALETRTAFLSSGFRGSGLTHDYRSRQ